ncbi:MAG: YihY/virulence factor BrkB family protein [Acidimicrobiales bacterium]
MSSEIESPESATAPVPPLTIRDLVRYLYRHWHDDRVSGLAAEIGFFALLSLFPLLLVMSAALGWLSDLFGNDLSTSVEDQLTDWSAQVFGQGGTVSDAVQSLFDGSSTSVLTVGVLVTIYTASRGFAAVVRALDVAYGHHNTRGWVGTQVIGLILAIGSIIVGAITLAGVVIAPIAAGDELSESSSTPDAFLWLWTWLRFPLAVLILVLWAATIFHLAPNRRASWRWELPGAVFAATAWLIATVLFSLYVNTLSSDSNPVYGAIGTAITIQVWLYLLAIGLVLGAELNGFLAERRGPVDNWTDPELFTRAFRALKRLVRQV